MSIDLDLYRHSYIKLLILSKVKSIKVCVLGYEVSLQII